jgi:hypothetical protein
MKQIIAQNELDSRLTLRYRTQELLDAVLGAASSLAQSTSCVGAPSLSILRRCVAAPLTSGLDMSCERSSGGAGKSTAADGGGRLGVGETGT